MPKREIEVTVILLAETVAEAVEKFESWRSEHLDVVRVTSARELPEEADR